MKFNVRKHFIFKNIGIANRGFCQLDFVLILTDVADSHCTCGCYEFTPGSSYQYQYHIHTPHFIIHRFVGGNFQIGPKGTADPSELCVGN